MWSLARDSQDTGMCGSLGGRVGSEDLHDQDRIATKFTYSQGRRLVGRDSILVMLSRRSAKGWRMLNSTPGSFFIEKRMEVLSRPVTTAGRRPLTRKRVVLYG